MPKTKKQRLHFYEKNDRVQTPKSLLDILDEVFHFDFDPCPLDPTFDGLSVDWGLSNFVNPPYSSIPRWIKKAVSERQKEKEKSTVLLVPVRTNTRYWFEHVLPNATRIFAIRKGIRFEGYDRPLPVPLCLIWITSADATERERVSAALAERCQRDALPGLCELEVRRLSVAARAVDLADEGQLASVQR